MSKKSNVIEPTALTIKKIDISGNIITALRSLSRYEWRPDFVTSNGIIIECKGAMDAKFPTLVRAFQEQHPILARNYRIAFQNPNAFLPTKRKGDRPSYADWADSVGIPWCHLQPRGRRDTPTIPESWLTDAFISTARKPRTEDNSIELWVDYTMEYEYDEDN